MTLLRIQSMVVGCVLFAGVPGAFAESVDDAIAKISAAKAGIQSMRYTTKFTISTKGTGMDGESSGTGTVEYKRISSDEYRMRNEMKAKTRQGDGPVQDETTLMIVDGKHSYTLMISGENKTAFKMALNKGMNMDPQNGQAIFAMQRASGELKLLPDASVGGKSCYVIEIVQKNPGGGGPGKARVVTYYDKATGIDMKVVGYDQEGQVVTTSETTKVEVGANIPDSRFVFKAPPGVQVIDAGAAQAQAGADGAGDEPAAEKKSPAKTSEEDKPAAKETKTVAKKDEPKPEKKEKKKGLGGLLKKIKIP